MIKIAPSILSADFANLMAEVKKIENSGADYLHVDVMDGCFVPNITFGPVVVQALRPHWALPIDVHLMIEEPGRHLDSFIAAGADLITVHAEADRHLHRTLKYIKDRGRKAGAAINPSTHHSCLEYILPFVDLIVIMSVNPGFGGQVFIPEVIPKIKAVKEILYTFGYNAEISVDGGIGPETVLSVVEAGANVVVAGSAVFGSPDPAQAVRNIKEAAARR
ncbi:MAG TPA: ribulose-phosphate 3-epimerase [Desulfotomaculum sp.]|nr:MAG: Ribulose-phosphate 3-epimerase [Desulfotomaculum sp. 46_80]HAG09835.1 ribulose-phosphate 3-epimerase [Desulfotomaculum sp.]HBY03890.1 ribulose-phosphate 3-epimerase [Desulfotomaculum sp.]